MSRDPIDVEPDSLLVERHGPTVVLTMNRPEHLNALGDGMLTLLLDALRDAALDGGIGCVVLTGAGRGFCAGGDMKARATGERPPPATPEAGADELRARMECSRLLHEMPKPTVAMVNGVAAGAGMSLALACDIRVAGEGARMTTAFAKMGFSGDFGGHWFLSRLVGPARAREPLAESSGPIPWTCAHRGAWCWEDADSAFLAPSAET